MSQSSFSTQVVHAGEQRVKPHQAITTPIFPTSTYPFQNTREMIDYMEAHLWGEETGREEYGRYGNPTVAAAEAKLAELAQAFDKAFQLETLAQPRPSNGRTAPEMG